MPPRDLKVLRARLGLRQVDLAELLAVTRNTVGMWERGLVRVSGPALKFLERMAADCASPSPADAEALRRPAEADAGPNSPGSPPRSDPTS